jgi:hypothetical protein
MHAAHFIFSSFDSRRLRNVCHLSRQLISLDLWILNFTSMTDNASWWADDKNVFLQTCFIIKFMTNMHFFSSISRTILMTKALISCLVLNTPDQLGRCLVQQGIFRFTQFECQLCFTNITNSSQLTLKLNFLYIKKKIGHLISLYISLGY